jgi:hypothetical protein
MVHGGRTTMGELDKASSKSFGARDMFPSAALTRLKQRPRRVDWRERK